MLIGVPQLLNEQLSSFSLSYRTVSVSKSDQICIYNTQ